MAKQVKRALMSEVAAGPAVREPAADTVANMNAALELAEKHGKAKAAGDDSWLAFFRDVFRSARGIKDFDIGETTERGTDDACSKLVKRFAKAVEDNRKANTEPLSD